VSESLRGQLLIAAPHLLDYFRRTVVLVVEHTEEGAMGVVLNRPTPAQVAEAVPGLADLASPGDVVHSGGPVQPDAVLVLGDFEDPAEAGRPVTGTLGLLDPERPDAAVRRVRVYAGYAGWGAGQLDEELERDGWVLEAAAPDDPFAKEDLWSAVLQRKGGRYALMATMPADPSLN
jgi:putative transcriptional regulator